MDCDMGYKHFTVLHKYSFNKVYKNVATGMEEVVCTNQIEGAWSMLKIIFAACLAPKFDSSEAIWLKF